MPHFVWLLLLGLTVLASGFSAPTAKESPVVLPAYKVVAPPLVALGVMTRLRANFFSGKVSRLTITRVLAGSVAAKAGLKAGDEIVGLRGQSILGLSKPEVIELGRIPAGEELHLSLRAKDDPTVREMVLKMP